MRPECLTQEVLSSIPLRQEPDGCLQRQQNQTSPQQPPHIRCTQAVNGDHVKLIVLIRYKLQYHHSSGCQAVCCLLPSPALNLSSHAAAFPGPAATYTISTSTNPADFKHPQGCCTQVATQNPYTPTATSCCCCCRFCSHATPHHARINSATLLT